MSLQQRIESGKDLLLAEVAPPRSGDPKAIRDVAAKYAGKVHALGISDNQHGVCMSALAAAAIVGQAGVEPILHIATRDRNRIALVAEYLGAQALAIPNVLCTSGTHQTLQPARGARAVFDLDAIQLLHVYANLADDGSVVGSDAINGADPLCLGAVASPFAEPSELQLLRLAKKNRAGARFFITQPVFDVKRFDAWWQPVKQSGLTKSAAILVGIRVLTSAEAARACAARWPSPRLPEAALKRVTSPADAAGQRAAGIALAVETIRQLSALEGLRGFAIHGGGDDAAALDVIAKCGVGGN